MDLYAWLLLATRELNLAKVGVEGSSPFARSRFFQTATPDQTTGRPLGGLSFSGNRAAVAVAGRWWRSLSPEHYLFGIRTTRILAVPVFTSRKRPDQNPLTGLFK